MMAVKRTDKDKPVPMDVVFHHTRDVEVEDTSHVWDIQSTTGHVWFKPH
jgi:hypothetical protein